MVSCLRDTGMPIAEMLRFAELVRSGEHTSADRSSCSETHDREVEAQISRLQERQDAIRRKIAYYRDVLALADNPSSCERAGEPQPQPS